MLGLGGGWGLTGVTIAAFMRALVVFHQLRHPFSRIPASGRGRDVGDQPDLTDTCGDPMLRLSMRRSRGNVCVCVHLLSRGNVVLRQRSICSSTERPTVKGESYIRYLLEFQKTLQRGER